MKCFLLALIMVCAAGCSAQVHSDKSNYVGLYDFGSGGVAKGYTKVLPANEYSSKLGYGFEPGAAVTAINSNCKKRLHCDSITSDKPFLFSVKLPEGNYRVTVTLGDASGRSNNTVKAEMRRLMLEKVETNKGEFKTYTMLVNTRTPDIAGGGRVRLKDREKKNDVISWDDKLTLEFNGERPCVSALKIEPAENIPTVFIMGDSTVCDASAEPFNSWGQMLTRFFDPEICIANNAYSGESIRSSLSAGRFNKVWSVIKPGDYLMIQYAHNDMKSKTPNALEIYRSDLVDLVAKAREHGVTPVLITSMERKYGLKSPTLKGYPDAVRDVAAKTNATLIDLNKMSVVLYKSLGKDIDKAFQDGTHHNAYGSYQLAKCVTQGIKDSNLKLKKHIVDDFDGYDPAKPDSWEHFNIPPSPLSSTVKPLGS